MFQHKDPPLLLAAKGGHLESVEVLVAAGARLDATDYGQLTAYDWARKRGHAEIAANLRQAMGLASNTLDGRDLLVAAKAGDVAAIEQALAQGVEVDYCDEASADKDLNTIPGRTALMWATIEGRLGAAQLLLVAGASPGKRESIPFGGGASVWELAARHGRSEILALLQGQSADASQLAEALITAARAGKLETVTQLLDAGVPVDVRDSEKQTSLMAAASKGEAAVLQLLLERSSRSSSAVFTSWVS